MVVHKLKPVSVKECALVDLPPGAGIAVQNIFLPALFCAHAQGCDTGMVCMAVDHKVRPAVTQRSFPVGKFGKT